MKTLYPSIFKISASFIALFIFASANAQTEGLATLNKQANSVEYSSAKKNVIDPVVKIKGRTETKIILNWLPFKGAVSHYVLERSTDGRNFQEIGLLFTGESGDEEPEYFFTDKFKHAYLGHLYYRLRVVGQEGSEIYTPPSILGVIQQ